MDMNFESQMHSSQIIRHSVHELRNIFCIVVGNLELLRAQSDQDIVLKLINRAMHGAQRADGVIATLTALSRGSSDQHQAAD